MHCARVWWPDRCTSPTTRASHPFSQPWSSPSPICASGSAPTGPRETERDDARRRLRVPAGCARHGAPAPAAGRMRRRHCRPIGSCRGHGLRWRHGRHPDHKRLLGRGLRFRPRCVADGRCAFAAADPSCCPPPASCIALSHFLAFVLALFGLLVALPPPPVLLRQPAVRSLSDCLDLSAVDAATPSRGRPRL